MSATFAPSRRLAGHTFFWPVAVFFVFLLFTLHAFAGQAILSWTAVQDSRVTGYNVHYGPTSGNYTSSYAAGNATSATVTGLTEGQTYYFVVRARDAAGTESANSNQVSKTIPAAAPTATISAAPTSGTTPLAVAFAIKSTNAPSYTWNFGDNTTSTSPNPTHTYTNTSTQPVTYTASLSSGGTVIATQTIKVNPSSSSSGSSTGTTSQAPNGTILSPSGSTTVATSTRVQFAGSGTGTNQPLSYSWDFGDGTTSTSQNPRHRYYAAGTYVAKLTVKDAKGYSDPTPATVTLCVGTCASSGSTSTSTSSSTSTSTPTATPTAATQTIWPASAAPSNPSDADSASANLGVKFKSSHNGYITGVRFYKSTANTGTHVGTLWSSSGQILATATFTNETASGWQQVHFATPVPITANTVYVASYLAPNGHYASDDNYFASNGVDSGPLHALSKPESGGNGVYAYAATTTFPNAGYQATNYWVDVVFTPAP